MAKLPPRHMRELSAKIASARQNLALLVSQLKAGVVEENYWETRLTDIDQLLDTMASERLSTFQQERLGMLYEVGKALGASLDIDEVLNQVMDAIIQLTEAERGYIMLFDEAGNLEVRAARNMDKETLEEEEFAISRSVIRTVAKSGKQVVTTNAAEDPRFAAQTSVVEHNLRSIQCVPLMARNNIIGAVYVDNRIRVGVFNEDDLEMLSAFAAQAAIAIENARLFTLTDEALSARVEELSMMQQIDSELNETLDFERTMQLTLDWAVRGANADNGAIGLIDLQEGGTRVIAQHGDTPAGVTALLNGTDSPADENSLTVAIQREGHVIGLIALDRTAKTPISDDDRAFVHRLAEHAAISLENARLYEEVHRANQAKSEFVSVMAHELRVPMTSIKGYSEMIGMVGELNEQQENFLRIVKSNIERMSLLVSDLSDLARIEAGRLNIELEKDIKVSAIIQDVITSLESEREKHEHTLELNLPDDLPTAHADAKRVMQVITNLLSNAYKYTPNGGAVTIRCKELGVFLRVDVSDNGVGMTEEELNQLYTKFWRAEDAHVREQPGTGLGLAIAKNLVELQGGEMQVESEKDKGTTFWFTVPVSK